MENTKIGNICPVPYQECADEYGYQIKSHLGEHMPGLRIDSSLRNIRIYICTKCGCLFAMENNDE
jgi:hypothetical protein